MTVSDTVQWVAQRFEALPALAEKDGDLRRRGRYLTAVIEVGVGPLPLAVTIASGRVESVERGPFLLRPWVFAIRAEADAWSRFLEPEPSAGFHDLMALSKQGLLRIEGNLHPFMANLQYVKDLLALPRTVPDAGGRRP